VRAVNKWGEKTQTLMALEEMGELIAVLAREGRGRVSREDVQSEIADVLIMALQLAHLYGPIGVARMVSLKSRRLKEYL
jgi:NTP pyrophosphatase (non-canonical NTP hydrolase)